MSLDIGKHNSGEVKKFKATAINKCAKVTIVALIWFYDPENLGVETEIKTLRALLVEILANIIFR